MISRLTRETIQFWAIALLLSLLAALGGFVLGRDWVGKQLAGALARDDAGVNVQQPASAEAAPGPLTPAQPPAEVKVEIEPRVPTPAEQLELTQKTLQEAADAVAASDTSPAETTEPAPAPPTEGYLVTAGSYVTPANAERVKGELERRGYQPHISQVKVRERTYYRVVVGAYGDREEAEQVAGKIQAAGFAGGVSGP